MLEALHGRENRQWREADRQPCWQGTTTSSWVPDRESAGGPWQKPMFCYYFFRTKNLLKCRYHSILLEYLLYLSSEILRGNCDVLFTKKFRSPAALGMIAEYFESKSRK